MVKRGALRNKLLIGAAILAALGIGYFIYRRSYDVMASAGVAAGASAGVVAKVVGADWCGYSKKQMGEMDSIKAKVAGSAVVEYHDADSEEGKSLVGANQINGFPSVIVYKNGQKKGEWSGFADADAFMKKLESYL
jgi:thiol-disulfide isomerase/thioredoxin